MGRYDVSLKNILEGSEVEILSLFGIKVKRLKVQDIEFSEVRERRADRIYVGFTKRKKVIVHFEIQLQYQKEFPLRMLEYFVLLKKRYKDNEIWQVVLCVGNKVPSRFVQRTPFNGVEYHFKVIDITKIPFRKFQESNNPHINALGILSNGADVRKIFQKIMSYKFLSRQKLMKLVNKIYILSVLVGREKEVEGEMEEVAKIDLTKTRLFRKGLRKGIEKGLKEGIGKGLKEGIQIDIEERFGEEGRYLIEMLKDIKDIGKLREIKRAINKAGSVKDLERILRNSK